MSSNPHTQHKRRVQQFPHVAYPQVASYGDLERALMTTPTVTETRRNGNPVGERVELSRYTVPAGQRILYGQRVHGVVRVTDVPAQGRGRAYLVERELERDGQAALKALVADYLLCRRRHRTYYADPFSMPIVDGEVLHLPRS